MSRFPAAFRPPAFASRVILFPPGSWAFLTVGLPAPPGAGPGRGFHVPHLRDTTGLGAPSTPGTAVLSRPDAVPGRRLPLRCGQSLHPAPHPTAGLRITRHQRGSRDSPVRSAPRLWPPDGTGDPWAFPELRTPPLPAAHVRAGPGVSTRPELRDRHSRPSNPRVPSQGATSCRNGR